ncbi:MAG TPA: class I SAM-dependent methyltransferase [Candidatus Acidoferrales bacterium]|nr:class I SAM-dependent methyltransferase [Candidatus Acidoferrales bacterium]
MIETNNPFDHLAAEYDAYRSGYSRMLYEVLAEYGFKPGLSLLDVACGTGLASEPLLKRGLQVTGVDTSESMLDKARIRLKEARLVVGDAEKLPFPDHSFDLVVCAQAIHWMDQSKAIAEMARVVAKDGRVAIWVKKMVSDEVLRKLRDDACVAVGVEPQPDIMAKGFRAFYQHPFKQHHLRVVPHVIMTDVDKWLGYERSRARKSHYGTKFDRYLEELERTMREMAGGKPFQVRYSQFLYIGEV